jgi:hypothetical protein
LSSSIFDRWKTPSPFQPEQSDVDSSEPNNHNAERGNHETNDDSDASKSDAPCEDSDLDEESKRMLDDVRKASAKQREKMIQRYATKHNIQRFEVGENVSVRVPRKARPVKALPRLFCQIIAKPHPDRYKLLSEHGLLDRHYATADLERLPSTISLSLPNVTEATTISLQKAAELSYLPPTTVSQPHTARNLSVTHRTSRSLVAARYAALQASAAAARQSASAIRAATQAIVCASIKKRRLQMLRLVQILPVRVLPQVLKLALVLRRLPVRVLSLVRRLPMRVLRLVRRLLVQVLRLVQRRPVQVLPQCLEWIVQFAKNMAMM